VEKAGDILKRILKDTRPAKGEATSSLYTTWDRIAGEPLSHHTRVADIAGRRLIIEVEHPGWHQMLLFQAKAILRKVQKEYPSLNVKEIRMRYHAEGKVRPMKQEKVGDKQVHAAKKGKSEGKVRKGEMASLGHISDEKLRKSLLRLYRGIVRKQAQSSPEEG
jgi:hypothetical protein